jgi:hypothetical protein
MERACTVDELPKKVTSLQADASAQRQPVFEAKIEEIVHDGICDEDRIVVSNVGAPISQVHVSELIYSTWSTRHRLARIQMERMTDICGHLALVDFDQLLAIHFHDSANIPRVFHMKISGFGYEEVSATSA